MKLSDADARLFYEAWWPLLDWVNAERRVVADTAKHSPTRPFAIADALEVRDVLWSDDPLRLRFVHENPAKLSAEALALVESWSHRRARMFCILKHYKKHTVFLDDSSGYAVLGLSTDLADMVPDPPRFAKAVLIPFDDRIVIDGLMTGVNVSLGPGIRRNQADQYRDVVERGALRTSLLPESLDPKARDERRRAVNLRVNFAFQATLRKSGLSDKVVSRDFFAVEKLAAMIAPRSLRDGPEGNLAVDVARFESAHGRLPDETWLSWKRFFVFLRDTGRVDYDEALDALEAIKELGRRAPHRR